MIYNIYGLVSPIDGQVVYVGCTNKSIEHKLKQHYWHLNEALRGERQMNKRFVYLNDLLPLKVSIKLLYKCDESTDIINHNAYERIYIEKYRKINPNLLNETDGGCGNNTHKYKTKEEIENIGIKISKALKGKSKSEEFKEHLSESRKGTGNPGCKKLDNTIYAYDIYTNTVVEKEFNYAFEIDDFIGSKHAWSNVKRTLNAINNRKGATTKYASSYGYHWFTKTVLDDFLKFNNIMSSIRYSQA